MNEAKKEKVKESLVEAGLMDPEDTLVDCLQANYQEKLVGSIKQWRKGWIYFTEKRVVYPMSILGAALGENNVVIPYQNIRKLGKCSQQFFPIGISITYEDPKTGEQVTDKFSMMKRNKWMDFLAERAGISLT